MMKKLQLVMLAMIAGTAGVHASLVLNAADDATIMKANPTTNYGSQTNVTGTKSGATNKVWVTFDASGLTGAITDIESMEAYSMASIFRSVAVLLITNSTYDAAWDESTITWNNAPGNNLTGPNIITGAGVVIGTFALPTAANQAVGFTFTNQEVEDLLIAALNTGDRRVTLVLQVNSPTSYFTYASLENTAEGAFPIRMTVVPEPATVSLLVIATIGLMTVHKMFMK